MRAYFAPCGIGLGHVTRCKVVLDRLKEQVPVRAFFATYYDALHYARSVGLDVLEIPPMTIVSKDTGEIDVKETIIYLTSRGRLAAIAVSQLAYDLKYIAAVNPDVVVSDTRAMAILAAKMLGIPCICITNQIRFYVPRKKRMLRISRLAEAGILAVIGEIWAMADEILVPDFPEPYTVCYMNLEVPDRLRRRLRFVGPILSKRPEELPDGEDLKEKLGFDPDRPLILAPVAGTERDRSFFVRTVFRMLKKMVAKGYQAVLSLGRPDYKHKVFMNKKDFKVFYWISDFPTYLKASDVVVLRGGHTSIMYCMAYGKPMLVVPTPSHTEQMLNALRVKKLGVAEVLLQEELSTEKAGDALRSLLEDDEHVKSVRAMGKVASGLDGVGEVVKAVLDLARAP